jgi:hypothetical protein
MNCVLLKKEIYEGLRIWAVLSHAMDDLNAARNAGQNRAALGYDLLRTLCSTLRNSISADCHLDTSGVFWP